MVSASFQHGNMSWCYIYKFSYCFIVHSKYFSVFNKVFSLWTFFKPLAYFSARFQNIKRYFLKILLKK